MRSSTRAYIVFLHSSHRIFKGNLSTILWALFNWSVSDLYRHGQTAITMLNLPSSFILWPFLSINWDMDSSIEDSWNDKSKLKAHLHKIRFACSLYVHYTINPSSLNSKEWCNRNRFFQVRTWSGAYFTYDQNLLILIILS